MADCCDGASESLARQEEQRGTLWTVLAINAVMFLVIVAASVAASSSALLADGLDNLGDALTYGLSLYAVTAGALVKARVALFKGVLILSAALFVTGQVIYRILNPEVPVFELMGLFSVLALIANGTCLFLLTRHRNDDINMSSVWECSRNDIAGNCAVFVAAGGVWLFDSHWPDIIVAAALVALLLRSATRVISGALAEQRQVVAAGT